MNMRFGVLAALVGAVLVADAAPATRGDEQAWQAAVQKFAAAKQRREKEPRAFCDAILALGESTYDKRDYDTASILLGTLIEEFRDDQPDGKKEDQIDGLVIEACETAFRKLTVKKAVDLLISRARDARVNLRIRFVLCRALGYQRGENKAEAVKLLVEMLDERDPRLLLGGVDGLREQLRADLSKKVDDLFQEAGSAGAHAAQVLEIAGPSVDVQATPLFRRRCETLRSALEDLAVGFVEREAPENYLQEIRAIVESLKDEEARKKVAPRLADLNDVVVKFLKIYDELTAIRKTVEPTMFVLLRMVADAKRPWEVRITALQAVRSDRHVNHVDLLIETLKGIQAADGRLRVDVMEALGAILGIKDPRTDDPNWWKSAVVERRTGKQPGTGGGTGSVPTEFFGLKTKSTRIVFVLDHTLSMDLPCTADIPKKGDPPPPPKRQDTPTGDQKPKDKPPPTAEDLVKKKAGEIKKKWDDKKIEKRIDALKREMISTVYNLDPRVQFAVVIFAVDAKNWKPSLLQATWANKLECIIEMDKMTLELATNVWAGLENAYKFVAEPQKPEVIQFDKKGNYVTTICGADTFFLMTDGNHNTGRFVSGGDYDDRAFFAEFKKINTLRRAVVNTIVLGDTGDNADPIQEKSLTLFKKMAEFSGGKFLHLGK